MPVRLHENSIQGLDEEREPAVCHVCVRKSLYREKIVADFADEVIWIMDESKLVEKIGTFPLPIEVLPYGYKQIILKLKNIF